MVLVTISHTISGQANLPISDSIYIYNAEKQKVWFYNQKDVFCFNFTDNSIYDSSLPYFIDTMFTYSNSHSIFNAVCFNETATELMKSNFINGIINLSKFNTLAYGISPRREKYSKKKYYPTDDLLLVVFKKPNVSDFDLTDFMDKYNLDLVHKPSLELPSGSGWIHIFKLREHPKDKFLTTVSLSNKINENEPNLVKLSEPNSFSAIPFACDAINELSASPDNNNYTWYIGNDGGTVYNGHNGVTDADADICECWNENLSGNGIKIGIVDFGGFEMNHPDFIGADIPFVFDASSNNIKYSQNFYYNNDSTTQSHAMLVGGIIIAQPNNIQGNKGHSIGSAYNATFYPYLCGNIIITGGGSLSNIAKAIQRAVLDKVDVLNMSFGLGTYGTLTADISNAVSTGRPDPNNPSTKRGMVITAAVGNADSYVYTTSPSHVEPIFPANQSYTLGIGYSTPEDYRATTSNIGIEGTYSWGIPTGTGSIYADHTYHFDVVAPGVVMRSTNYVYGNGNGYLLVSGSSLASPLVASIVAMILEKRPDLTYQQIQEIIRNGAEKVNSINDGGPYEYLYGYNQKMFFGRVSCINSLQIAETLSLQEISQANAKVKDMGDGIFIIEAINIPLSEVHLYGLDGKLILEKNNTSNSLSIDLNNYPQGMYVLNLIDTKGQLFSLKLIR